MLFNKDCLHVLSELPDSSVDMIYLDPPFYTQKNHKLSDALGKTYEFSDTWNSRKDYLDYIKERLMELKRVLKSTGNIFLHCDTSASHYLRVLLDEIFGESNFRSEIIWSYKRWSNSKNGLLPAHQTIFMYSKSGKYKFNTIYGEYSPTTNLDQILQERERDSKGKAVYKLDEFGEVVSSKEKKGVPTSDVWEIPFLNPKAKERTGYPTQKPIELLERIILISTDIGDTVLDPFCGSGTTLVSAKLLDRKFIGIDINQEAIELCQKRLDTPYKTVSTLLKIGANAYQTKTDAELSILKQFECDIVQRNKGIDAFLKKHYLSSPVAIRIQRSGENFEEAITLLKNASILKKCRFTIFITNEATWKQYKNCIPSNMIVIERYDTYFENVIEDLILKQDN